MNDYAVNTSVAPAKKLLSKPVFLTLGCSLSAIAVIVLARAVCAAVTSQKLDVYDSLYFMFGSSSVFFVNLIMGILLAAAIGFLAVGVFAARGAAKDNASAGSVKMLKTASVVGVVMTGIMMLLAFSSVGVLNYARVGSMTSQTPDGSATIQLASANNADMLFWAAILLGTVALLTEISLIRFSNGLYRNLKNAETVKPGTAIMSIASLIGGIVSAVIFCTVLYQLVTPSQAFRYSIANDLATTDALAPGTLVLNSLNVLLYACIVVFFVAATITAFSYAANIDTINRAARGYAYNNMYSASNPMNLPDYSGPANYNYHQTPSFTPVYDANRYYQSANKSIYDGVNPPVPKAPVNPFKPQQQPLTQYPSQPEPVKKPDTPDDSASPENRE